LWLAVEQILTIAVIGLLAWVVVETVQFAFEGAKSRYPIGAEATRAARRAQTQLIFLQRLATVTIWIVAVSAALLTFPEMQALGASLLASAGLAGIIAGLAAQSTLSNVFAGVQIAFSDAIRVDDIVIVEGEWGRIEEITLTYVVVRIWDDRRLVVPSTHFTTTPFENWTRTGSELLGSIELDLDWRVSPAAMRERDTVRRVCADRVKLQPADDVAAIAKDQPLPADTFLPYDAHINPLRMASASFILYHSLHKTSASRLVALCAAGVACTKPSRASLRCQHIIAG
jgi:hypothetical protein